MKYILDLEKSRYKRSTGGGRTMHKYVKRTGTPGNYKYWYKDDNGYLTIHNDDMQEQGKRDHARRLAIGHLKGIEEKNLGSRTADVKAEIARRTGLPVTGEKSVENIWRNLHKKRNGLRAFESADYETEHLREAHQEADPVHISFADQSKAVQKIMIKNAMETDAWNTKIINRVHEILGIERSGSGVPTNMQDLGRQAIARLKGPTSVIAGPTPVIASEPTPEPTPVIASEPTPEPTSEADPKKAEIKDLLKQLKDSGFSFGDIGKQEVEQASASVKRIQEVQQNQGILSNIDPLVADVNAEISDMESVSASGGNPYLTQAINVWNSVKSSYEDRKTDLSEGISDNARKDAKSRHEFGMKFFSFLDGYDFNGKSKQQVFDDMIQAGVASRIRSNSNLDKAFNTVDGKLSDITGFTVSELMENKPLDPEVERMKRGYGRKQFDRLRDYISDEWKNSNGSAPPPYPTFGDLKKWGNNKPAYAETSTISMPQEIYSMLHRNEEGRLMLPPTWMSIEHMPLFQYATKKVLDSDSMISTAVYAGRGSEMGRNIAPIATKGDGIVVNAIRKYVQRRGGAEGLIDMPKSSLEEVGMTHADLFKSMSDEEIKKIMLTKYIPMHEIIPFIDAEFNEAKKSFVVKSQKNIAKMFVVSDTRKKLVIRK